MFVDIVNFASSGNNTSADFCL